MAAHSTAKLARQLHRLPSDAGTPDLVGLRDEMFTVIRNPLPRLGEIQRVDIAARSNAGLEKGRELFHSGERLVEGAAFRPPGRADPDTGQFARHDRLQ